MKLFSPVFLNKTTYDVWGIRINLLNLLISIIPFGVFGALNIVPDPVINLLVGLFLSLVLFVLLFPSPFNKNRLIYQTLILYYKRKKGTDNEII